VKLRGQKIKVIKHKCKYVFNPYIQFNSHSKISFPNIILKFKFF
jgi:hypothetical protein